MKRFSLAMALLTAIGLGAVPHAAGDTLYPTDPNGPYANARGSVNVTYKTLWQRDSWGNRYKASYYDLKYRFSGLVADPVNGTNYILMGVTATGYTSRLEQIGTLDGSATSEKSWWDGWGSVQFVYFELWLARIVITPDGLYHWEPVGTAPVLSSQ